MNSSRKPAFIFDLDGTLLDSYGEIVSSTKLAFDTFGIKMEEEEILQYLILHSGYALLKKAAEEFEVPLEELHSTYQKFHSEKADEVTAAVHAEQILQELAKRGCPCYVFTHRGSSTVPILKRLNLHKYFTEIITMEDGFPRKPAPDANLYLIGKYQLDRTHTYFVGDRQLDMECARNAGVKTVLYLPEYSVARPAGTEDYVISDFMEILDRIVEQNKNGKILH